MPHEQNVNQNIIEYHNFFILFIDIQQNKFIQKILTHPT